MGWFMDAYDKVVVAEDAYRVVTLLLDAVQGYFIVGPLCFAFAALVGERVKLPCLRFVLQYLAVNLIHLRISTLTLNTHVPLWASVIVTVAGTAATCAVYRPTVFK